MRVRIADFHTYLCGTDDQGGFLQSLDLPFAKVAFSEERLRQYTHFLGFGFDDTGSGAFNDEHESSDNRRDRHERFLPLHFDLFRKGISTFEMNGVVLDVDTRLEDQEGNDLMEHRTTLVTIEDSEGNIFDIDMGGIIPEGDGRVPLLISHDESCFGAGEYENKVTILLVPISLFLWQAWQESGKGKKICKDKTTGPKWHLSGFVVEFGNGVICKRPDQPPPSPIHLKELGAWYDAFSKGVEVPLPTTADVWMRPGKNHDGWWLAEQFWKQCHLAIAILRHLFSRRHARFQPTLIPDWSQNHAAMSPDGLDAENMLVNSGGQTAKHLRHTFVPKEARTRTVGRRVIPVFPRVPREPLCRTCFEKEAVGNMNSPCRLAFNEHGHNTGFQSVGEKGLRLILEERGVDTKGMYQPQLVPALQQHSDFAKRSACERAHVTEIWSQAGYLCVFGVKYHSDFAHCERKWMFMKANLRNELNGVVSNSQQCLTSFVLAGKWDRLLQLVDRAYKQYTVHDVRRNARHCRDTMRAYETIGNKADTELNDITALEKKYKGHRRVFDAVTNELMMVADMPRTTEQIKVAMRTAKARSQKVERAAWLGTALKEIACRFTRRDRANRTNEQRDNDNESAKARKALLVRKQYLSKAKAVRNWKDNAKGA